VNGIPTLPLGKVRHDQNSDGKQTNFGTGTRERRKSPFQQNSRSSACSGSSVRFHLPRGVRFTAP